MIKITKNNSFSNILKNSMKDENNLFKNIIFPIKKTWFFNEKTGQLLIKKSTYVLFFNLSYYYYINESEVLLMFTENIEADELVDNNSKVYTVGTKNIKSITYIPEIKMALIAYNNKNQKYIPLYYIVSMDIKKVY